MAAEPLSNPREAAIRGQLRGDGIDWCLVCGQFGPPEQAIRFPVAVVPDTRGTGWVSARYLCPVCGYGWWRPWPAPYDVDLAAITPKSNKARSRRVAWEDENR